MANKSIDNNAIGVMSIDNKTIEHFGGDLAPGAVQGVSGQQNDVGVNTLENKSMVSTSIETKTNDNDSMVSKSIDKISIDLKTIENNSIEYPGKSPTLEETAISIDQNTMVNNTIENKSMERDDKKASSPGILPTSIRIVREELLRAMNGLVSAEVKIGDIAPLTGLTRRTVDRVCKHLEKSGEFSFERLHRGMKVTVLR